MEDLTRCVFIDKCWSRKSSLISYPPSHICKCPNYTHYNWASTGDAERIYFVERENLAHLWLEVRPNHYYYWSLIFLYFWAYHQSSSLLPTAMTITGVVRLIVSSSSQYRNQPSERAVSSTANRMVQEFNWQVTLCLVSHLTRRIYLFCKIPQ